MQAILQIFPWSKNTRTHQELEWFGPPERNTLRPLCVVLLLSFRMSLTSALRSPFRPQSFSSGRPPFIAQGGHVHRRWTPTGGPNKDVVYYEKDINGATVVENLFPDTLHCTVDSLTKGGVFTCPIGETPVEVV